jgi:hypothetical protein
VTRISGRSKDENESRAESHDNWLSMRRASCVSDAVRQQTTEDGRQAPTLKRLKCEYQTRASRLFPFPMSWLLSPRLACSSFSLPLHTRMRIDVARAKPKGARGRASEPATRGKVQLKRCGERQHEVREGKEEGSETAEEGIYEAKNGEGAILSRIMSAASLTEYIWQITAVSKRDEDSHLTLGQKHARHRHRSCRDRLNAPMRRGKTVECQSTKHQSFSSREGGSREKEGTESERKRRSRRSSSLKTLVIHCHPMLLLAAEAGFEAELIVGR